jgi:neuron navigator 2
MMQMQTYKRHRLLLQAHVVSAFEQSLSNMTTRLQQLTATAEAKVTDRRTDPRSPSHLSLSAGL